MSLTWCCHCVQPGDDDYASMVVGYGFPLVTDFIFLLTQHDDCGSVLVLSGFADSLKEWGLGSPLRGGRQRLSLGCTKYSMRGGPCCTS
jgi:hypothetical protein